jgi:nickel-dependent lactate racemase
MSIIKVPQLAWYEPRDLELTFPDSWHVEVCYMTGYNRSELTVEELRATINNPIGCKRLSEIARGKKEVAILFDDTSRVTRTAKIVPLVLEELAAAGIPDKNIRFICAVGVHAPLYRQDMVKKLGDSRPIPLL